MALLVALGACGHDATGDATARDIDAARIADAAIDEDAALTDAARMLDARVDLDADAGPLDAGPRDAGPRDAGPRDSGTDAHVAPRDAGTDAHVAARDSGIDAHVAPRDSGIDAPIVPRDAGTDARPSPIDASPGPCGTWTGRRPIRTLFVGNSQIDFWDLAQLVSDLSASAPPDCPRIVGERFTSGGANLQELWEGTDSRGRHLSEVIALGAYDAVVIAESIDLVELRPPFPALFVEYASRIIDATRAAGGVPFLYATPYVERPDTTGFFVMADDQLALGAALGVRVAAGGLAWLRVWSERPGIDLYYVDRQHPGYRGSYVSASVIYATITGASPVGLTNTPTTTACAPEPCPYIPPDEADVFQRAAWAEHLATGR